MEDSSDSLSDIFKKPDSIRFVQNQSRVSESPVSLSSKDNSVSNVSDSGSVLSTIFQKPPNLLCESIARIPKRKKKCLNRADTKVTSLSVKFSACDTTESSVVLPKKRKRSAANQSTNSKALSVSQKNDSSFLLNTFPPAHSQSINTSNGQQSSVVLNKKKSTLKGSKRFSTSHLFDSEPNSVFESFTETERKTKHFRSDSRHQQLSLKDLSECSNVSGGTDQKLLRKPLASFVDKENIDVNFGSTVSSVSDSIIEKRDGDILNTSRKTKNSRADVTVDIFSHPEGSSFDCESSIESESEIGVSFAQPTDCSRLTSQSCASKTQTTDTSVSLVRKMCEDKSTLKGAGKMLPPKMAPKKRRRALRFELDSDDKQAGDSTRALPKKPNLPKFHRWCGKQFYNRIIEKMRPKYGLKTNAEAVRLAEYVWQSVKQVEGCRDADANHAKVEEMKRTLARKQIVVTHYQFYVLCVRSLPPTFHQKALPMGPLFPCKFDLAKWNDAILDDS